MKPPKELEEIKSEIETAKAKTELFKEAGSLKKEQRRLNNPYLYSAWDEAKADTKGFFQWFEKFLIDINRPIERRPTLTMEFYEDEVSEQPVKKEKFDNGCDFDFSGCDLGVERTPFTDF